MQVVDICVLILLTEGRPNGQTVARVTSKMHDERVSIVDPQAVGSITPGSCFIRIWNFCNRQKKKAFLFFLKEKKDVF